MKVGEFDHKKFDDRDQVRQLEAQERSRANRLEEKPNKENFDDIDQAGQKGQDQKIGWIGVSDERNPIRESDQWQKVDESKWSERVRPRERLIQSKYEGNNISVEEE